MLNVVESLNFFKALMEAVTAQEILKVQPTSLNECVKHQSESVQTTVNEDGYNLTNSTRTRLFNEEQDSKVNETQSIGKAVLNNIEQADTEEKPFQCKFCFKKFLKKCALVRHASVHSGEKQRLSSNECVIQQRKNLQTIVNRDSRDKTNFKGISEGQSGEKSVLSNVEQTDSKEKPFQCEFCFKRFLKKCALVRHTNIHTGDKAYQSSIESLDQQSDVLQTTFNENCPNDANFTGSCPFNEEQDCETDETQSIKNSVLINIEQNDPEATPYPCMFCMKSFRYRSALIRHTSVHAGEKPLKCSNECVDLQTESLQITFHEDEHNQTNFIDNNPLDEEQDDMQCSEASVLSNFKQVVTEEKPYQCEICLERFLKKSALIRHTSVHTGEKPYQCEICAKRFREKSKLIRHEQVHLPEKLYQCEICVKQFSGKFVLIRHLRRHMGEKPHQCDICIKDFCEKSALNRHRRVHTGEKPFQCNICMKQFRENSKLNLHKRVHSGEKPYQCEICTRTFSDNSAMNRHRRVHTGEKPHQCELCMKRFSEASFLNIHRRVHTREKPYQCDICMVGFSLKSSLNNHRSVHTGDKPHQCDICMKEFSQKGHVIQHRRVHTGEKPYQCDVCKRRFTQNSHLNQHRRLHGSNMVSIADVYKVV